MLQYFGAKHGVKTLVSERDGFAVIVDNIRIGVAEAGGDIYVDALILGALGIEQMTERTVTTTDVENSSFPLGQFPNQVAVYGIGLKVDQQAQAEGEFAPWGGGRPVGSRLKTFHGWGQGQRLG